MTGLRKNVASRDTPSFKKYSYIMVENSRVCALEEEIEVTKSTTPPKEDIHHDYDMPNFISKFSGPWGVSSF